MPDTSSSSTPVRWQWWLIGLSLVYLLIEFIFNATLLHTASSLELDDDALHRVELFGRSVSGAGFTLLLLGVLARFRFDLGSWPRRTAALAVMVVCLVPFLLDTAGDYRVFGVVVAIGAIIAASSMFRGGEKTAVLPATLGTVMMAWVAMFAGQKIIIEHFLIEPASWETRLNAQYMHLLKNGLARNLIEIEGAPFDSANLDAPEERTFLALVGVLVMDSPEFVSLVKRQEEQLVSRVSHELMYDELQHRYAAYQREGEAFQDVWQRYSDGSRRYYEARQTADSRARDEYAGMLNGVQDGYNDYLKGEERFFRSMKPKAEQLAPELKRFFDNRAACKQRSCVERWDNRYAQRIKRFLGKEVPWTYWCDERDANIGEAVTDGINLVVQAPFALLGTLLGQDTGYGAPDRYSCSTETEHLQHRLVSLHADEFAQKSGGYPPGIDSLDAFIAEPITARRVRERMHKQGLALPTNWQLRDSATFTRLMAAHIRDQAARRWRSDITAAAGGYIPPNYSYRRMVQHKVVQQRIKNAMGDAYIPGMNFEFTEMEFKRRIIDPETSRSISRYLKQLREDAEAFANGGEREHEGKQFHRAVLIPPISLFLSLFFALLTTGKIAMAVVNLTLSGRMASLAAPVRRGVNTALWGGVIAAVVVTPYFVPNKFSDSRAFEYFAERAAESSPVFALMAEWTIRMQPVLYPLGRLVQKPISGAEASWDWDWPTFGYDLNATQREQVRKALAAGKEALAQDRLMTPKDRAAFTYYSQVLELQPDNDEAIAGLERIVRRYELLAKAADSSGKASLKRTYLQRAQTVREHLQQHR